MVTRPTVGDHGRDLSVFSVPSVVNFHADSRPQLSGCAAGSVDFETALIVWFPGEF